MDRRRYSAAMTVALALIPWLVVPGAFVVADTAEPAPEAADQDDEARLMLARGRKLVSEGRPADALPFFEHAIDMAEARLPAIAPGRGILAHELGTVYAAAGQDEKAEAQFQRALKEIERSLGAEHPELLGPLGDLASLVGRAGRYREAEAFFGRMVELLTLSKSPGAPEVTAARVQLAGVIEFQGRTEEAKQLYLQAVEAADREGRESTALAAALGNLGALHSRLGQPAEAEAWLARTLDLRRRLLGPRHWLTALTAKDLGVVQEQQGRIAEALGSTATAAAALGNRCGASGSDPPPYVSDLCSDLAVLRRRLERATPTRGAPAPPTTDVAGGHWTQLAARDSAAGAREEIRALGLRFPALLGALPSRVERVDLGDRGTWHRVQYGGFTTRAEAVVLCEALAAAGWGDCFVPRPETAP